ncbi:MAG TPA: AlpA family phage regulatory protein [Allosphingosinicella sp.]|jgi:prophage regulatory protein
MSNADQFLRLPQVKAEIGLSRQTIDRLEKKGEFPKRHLLSPRCVGWWRSDLETWKAKRLPVATNQRG